MWRSERDEWLADLRSGEFIQGHGVLAVENDQGQLTFCCLGVKCERDARTERHGIVRGSEHQGEISYGVTGKWDNKSATMPTAVILDAWRLAPEQATTLARMNDNDRLPFTEIADWIEANVPVEDDSTTVS
jgi:hypothetical protein